MWGDIGDPITMQNSIKDKFKVTNDQVLHVRSFIDHDRPYIAPKKAASPALKATIDNYSDAAYTEPTGVVVPPSMVFLSLVEHLERWRACLGKFGLIVLEVSNLPVKATTKHLREATSLHFDSCQSHSGQMLMPAVHYTLGASSAGLLPTPGILLYPKEAPFTRIVLQNLRPDDLVIRLALPEDLPTLTALEKNWGTDCLIASKETLATRLQQHPMGQFVALKDGKIVGAMYTQRVASAEVLHTAKRETELSLHTPTGPVVQLLGVVVVDGPEGANVGDKLRNHTLLMGKLDPSVEKACGVTRCRNRKADDKRDYATYVKENMTDDYGLVFHSGAGATIGQLVAEYRVKDTINFGYGVMITYELRGSKEETSAAATTEALKLDLKGGEKLVCGILDAMREEMVGEWDVGKKQKGFMELGLDSLDVVQLVAKINDKTGLNLPQTVVFDKPNAQSLARYVFEQCGPAEQPTCGTRAAPPTRSIGAPPSNGSPWTAYIPPDTEGLQELMESIPQLPDGSIDLNWFLTPPQGDRSAEGYMYNPTLGYHKDIGEAFWEGKALTYVKLKQIQAIASLPDNDKAYDMEVETNAMQHWDCQQALAYFKGKGKPSPSAVTIKA